MQHSKMIIETIGKTFLEEGPKKASKKFNAKDIFNAVVDMNIPIAIFEKIFRFKFPRL